MGQPETRSQPRLGEDGFTILEVIIALTIFAIVITGLATSTALGLRIVSASNGRQIASQLATKELEKLRRTPYLEIGLNGSIISVPGTLDDSQLALSIPPGTFLVPGGLSPEPLVPVATGDFFHSDPAPATTVNVEGFSFTITRYVTWVDDPDIAGTQDYKRASIAVQWRQKTAAGAPSRVVLSSLFGVGKVIF